MEAAIVNEIVRNIYQQFNCIEQDVRWSWGAHDFKAEVIKPGEWEMAALSFLVQGFNFKGRIWIALNEGSDLYEIYGRKHGSKKMVLLHEDVFCDDLQDILDPLIETGGEKGQAFYANSTTPQEAAVLMDDDEAQTALMMKILGVA